ncbi:lethal(2) giant larvae protein homolog 1 isoform X2 [Bubalus kerabau]|uniref:lethal(2) giant larvae protein homolog 1 isoform X2 n=1 Tax=Bubalus bubalis TaxID=89462 RepID=UPI000DBC89B6|nr:lethal(2) giant larvae protein homolog 1 isoform X2 [Bubalus bubalis]XP_055432308.1 lethal(2) giant larvae protein homolog 1 isoform X2 [Bubalus carabanensis]
MMKFRFRRQGADPQREKLKQELFAFHKTVEHGFPNQPSALAFDPELRIMAIGTRSGAVKIYGAPGVEFTGLHRDAATVTQMHFLPGQGRVLTLLDDDSLHLWEIVHHDGCAHLEEALHFQAPSRPCFDGASGLPSLTHITVVLLVAAGDMAALGTEGGSIFFLDVPTLTLLEGQTLGPDEVLRSVPDDYRCGKALGPVESLQGHLRDPTKILIGYSRGLLVIWNQAARCAERIFLGNQLESVCWERSGHTVVSSHSDGSYAIWAADTGDSPAAQPTVATTPYGPFPCKAINKVLWRSCASGEHFVIFSGGMPRASYGDRHCVSVLQAETLVTLDFTSRVIDFFTVHSTRPEDEFDEPQALAVLLEEELVVLDLQTPGWPAVPAPYLAPLHSSAITCSAHVANVPAKLWARIVSAGEQQSPQPASGASSWPITGGRNLAQEPSQRGLLLTGHEDGTVRFWDASGVALRPLYKLCTAGLFQTDCEHTDSLAQAAEDDWPPFRKVGCFDPYSDDPRLGVQKVALCKYTAQMVVAGTAGQVLVLELSDMPAEQTVGVASLDLLQDREGFTWKGHERLSPRLGPLPWPAGFQPRALVQCLPPAAVTAVTLHAEWGLVAFGTSHGFGLFDYLRRSPVLARCTLHPSDSLAMEGPLSRVKSLKKSLRQSFRRIRKSRASGKKRMVAGSKLQEANAQLAEQAGPQDVEVTPVQRRIEPRSADDSLSGVVRCLYFADTFLRDAAHHGPTMWAGTNSGSVFAYALEVPAAVAGGEKRPERAVEAVLGKEVQLMHRAPVVAIAVLDGRGRPLPEPYEASRDLAQAPDMQGGHAVLIASEEQFKVFTLPKVSAKTKFKLTAHEGCRVRKVALATFASVACEDYSETCLACLTNLGDVHVFSVPGLRPQVHYACIRKEDISGIASCVFTRHGQGFYLISPSEFERFSLSARNITEPLCSLDVRWPQGATHVRSQESPKLSQANGTPGIILAPQSCDGSPDPICKEADTPEPPEAMLSPMSIDSATSADTTLDTTGDMTVEDVKDFLGSSEESEKNLRNLSEEEARACAILIK